MAHIYNTKETWYSYFNDVLFVPFDKKKICTGRYLSLRPSHSAIFYVLFPNRLTGFPPKFPATPIKKMELWLFFFRIDMIGRYMLVYLHVFLHSTTRVPFFLLL